MHEINSLNDVCGNHHAKRAIEVALVGDFSILFVGTPRSEAEALADYAKMHDLWATDKQRCPCGDYGNPLVECTCSARAVADWQRATGGLSENYDIVVYVPDNSVEDIISWMSGRRGEDDEVVLGRVADATEYTDTSLGDTETSLLKAAITQLSLGYGKTLRVVEVARAIANLAHSEVIRAAHLAEALQYVPTKYNIL